MLSYVTYLIQLLIPSTKNIFVWCTIVIEIDNSYMLSIQYALIRKAAATTCSSSFFRHQKTCSHRPLGSQTNQWFMCSVRSLVALVPLIGLALGQMKRLNFFGEKIDQKPNRLTCNCRPADHRLDDLQKPPPVVCLRYQKATSVKHKKKSPNSKTKLQQDNARYITCFTKKVTAFLHQTKKWPLQKMEAPRSVLPSLVLRDNASRGADTRHTTWSFRGREMTEV